jgi:citrate lyase subunit beta / citryl-CoA lyase
MVQKALASSADGVFLDLEDAVAPDDKASARTDVVRALKELDWRGRPKLYRANALDTPYFYRDLIEVVEVAGASLDAVMVPKVNSSEDLHVAATLLTQLELATGLEPGRTKLEAQIESAAGLTNVDAIARATNRLKVLHFGPGDFAASLRMPQTSIGVMDEWDEAYPGRRCARHGRAGRRLPRRGGPAGQLPRRPFARLRRQVVYPPGPDRGGQRGLFAH